MFWISICIIEIQNNYRHPDVPEVPQVPLVPEVPLVPFVVREAPLMYVNLPFVVRCPLKRPKSPITGLKPPTNG
jgi:hypothetical protein